MAGAAAEVVAVVRLQIVYCLLKAVIQKLFLNISLMIYLG